MSAKDSGNQVRQPGRGKRLSGPFPVTPGPGRRAVFHGSDPLTRVSAGARRGGFTLVEILIVVLILGILASIVIPKLSNASTVASENTLKEDLRYMRTQIQVFRFQHMEIMPGRNGGGYDAATFVSHMTLASDINGSTAASSTPGYPYGPYLRRVPVNPLNNKSSIQVVSGTGALPAPDDSDGWMYQPETNTFVADTPGNDAGGVSYVNY